jgi:thiol-disulfide isomerase/thioredoxin
MANLDRAPMSVPSPGPAQTGGGRARLRSDRRFKLTALVACVALVGLVAYAVTQASTHKPEQQVMFPAAHPTLMPAGRVAPAFSLARLGGGPPVVLHALLHEPVVMNFFASWCTNCRAELSTLASVAQKEQGKVQFVGIDASDANPALAVSLLAKAGATYPVGVDRPGSLTNSYLVSDLPVTMFIDTQGRVVGELYGAQTTASLERGIRGLLAIPAPR